MCSDFWSDELFHQKMRTLVPSEENMTVSVHKVLSLYGVYTSLIAGFKLLVQLGAKLGRNAEWPSLYGVSTGQSLPITATSKA